LLIVGLPFGARIIAQHFALLTDPPSLSFINFSANACFPHRTQTEF
jgi:hypothetical protein